MGKYVLQLSAICAAVNGNNYTGACNGLLFFTFPQQEERQAHCIAFARNERALFD